MVNEIVNIIFNANTSGAEGKLKRLKTAMDVGVMAAAGGLIALGKKGSAMIEKNAKEQAYLNAMTAGAAKATHQSVSALKAENEQIQKKVSKSTYYTKAQIQEIEAQGRGFKLSGHALEVYTQAAIRSAGYSKVQRTDIEGMRAGAVQLGKAWNGSATFLARNGILTKSQAKAIDKMKTQKEKTKAIEEAMLHGQYQNMGLTESLSKKEKAMMQLNIKKAEMTKKFGEIYEKISFIIIPIAIKGLELVNKHMTAVMSVSSVIMGLWTINKLNNIFGPAIKGITAMISKMWAYVAAKKVASAINPEGGGSLPGAGGAADAAGLGGKLAKGGGSLPGAGGAAGAAGLGGKLAKGGLIAGQVAAIAGIAYDVFNKNGRAASFRKASDKDLAKRANNSSGLDWLETKFTQGGRSLFNIHVDGEKVSANTSKHAIRTAGNSHPVH